MSDIETLDLASENQRLRERVAELEAQAKELTFERDIAWHDGPPEEVSGLAMRATKAEAERDAALAQVAELETEKAHILQGLAESTKKRLDALAQVAVLREALTELVTVYDAAETRHDGILGLDWDSSPDSGLAGQAWACAVDTLASTPAPTRAEAEAWLRAGEPVRGALAVPAEPDYSGLCAAPSCEGHCGYVHARGCEAVREYLADHGGEPYRAPSPPDILRRVAERARERIAALAYDAGRPDLCARVRAIDLNVLLDGGE